MHGVGGDLSALPFQSLRNATDAQLKCFQGGLGQATDTYNVGWLELGFMRLAGGAQAGGWIHALMRAARWA